MTVEELQEQTQFLERRNRALEIRCKILETMLESIKRLALQLGNAFGMTHLEDVHPITSISKYRSRRFVTDDERQRMKEMYVAGNSMQRIGSTIGLHEKTVRDHLIEMGVHEPLRELTEADIHELIDMHTLDQRSAHYIAAKKHLSVSTVTKYLKAAGVFRLKPPSPRKRRTRLRPEGAAAMQDRVLRTTN